MDAAPARVQLKTTVRNGVRSSADIEVYFHAGNEADALDALNRAYAEARRRIESNTVTPPSPPRATNG